MGCHNTHLASVGNPSLHGMTNMIEDAHEPHISSGTDTAESLQYSSVSTESKVFSRGTTHGCDIWLQIDDNGRLHREISSLCRNLDRSTGHASSSDNPHKLGRLNGNWTAGSDYQDIGLFPSGVEYGSQSNSGNWTQNDCHVLNLYDSICQGTSGIANNARKLRVEVHERADGLVYEDGNEYSWPAGWQTEQQYEGTAIRIQASYVFDLYETIRHAFEYLLVAFSKARVKRYARDIIHETVRFSGLELHHRHHLRTKDATVQTLRDSARLVVSGDASGKEKATVERGHYQVYAFSTTNLEAIGFDTDITYELPTGESRTASVPKHYLKEYMHKEAHSFSDSHALAHPKLEVKHRGAFPAPAWDAMVEHLHEVLHAHVDWAGISEDDLISDEWYTPGEPIETATPEDYKIKLREYFESDGLQRTVIGMLFERQTMAIHDILHLVVRNSRNNRISYDELAELTGLSKSTIGGHVAELEGHQLVSRDHQGRAGMWVTVTEYAKKKVGGLLDKMRTCGDVLRNIASRKKQRKTDAPAKRRAQEEAQQKSESESDSSTVKPSDPWTPEENPRGRYLGGQTKRRVSDDDLGPP